MTCDKDFRTYIHFFDVKSKLKITNHVVVSFLENLLITIKNISYKKFNFF